MMPAIHIPPMTERQLAGLVREACDDLGWRFLWLEPPVRCDGILNVLVIPLRDQERRAILHRELKGYRSSGELSPPTVDQAVTVEAIQRAGGNADIWTPADWFNGRITNELT